VSSLPKPRILIIDDEKNICDSLIRVCRAEGYEAVSAPDGQSGLDLLSQFKPDAVFCDLKMPGLSGFEVLERGLAQDPHAVFVVITGYATIGSAVESIKKGAFDFLPKPFTPEELRIIARRALARSRLLHETDRLRREKERMQEKFMGMVSHQLRSPLVAVRQYHDVLLEGMAGELSGEQREILGRSRHRLNELLELIRDWLSFSRLDEKAVRANAERFALRPFLKEITAFLQKSVEEKKVRIILPEDDGITVCGDRRLLKEALVNCLSNAVQYNRAGGEVAVHVSRDEGGVSIRIRDTGMGIPDQDLEKIFDEFFRCRETRDIPGTGLGLAIVKRIIELHGGTVGVTSRLGEGSEFTLRLPDPANQESGAAELKGEEG
jgi:two-component system sensor histidine kinase/response regulator